MAEPAVLNERPAPRPYLGKPENQRNPRAKNAHIPRVPRPAQTNKVPANVPPTLPSPRHLQKGTQEQQPLAKGSPFADSIFSTDQSAREINLRTTFSPSLIALPDISTRVYQELLVDDPNLSKVLLPEYLTYYDTALAWLRITTLKLKNDQPLTQPERQVIELTQATTFTVLEPERLYLQGLGNIVTRTGQHLYPTFPPLPHQAVAGFSGYYGPLNDDTHNNYEEVPCLGVTAEAVRHSVSDEAPGVYPSALAPAGQLATRNLLGFAPLQFRRAEAKNLAFAQGITPDVFPSTVHMTGLNLPFIRAISQRLATTTTFKTTQVCFSTLAETGSPAQQVISRPVMEDATRCVLALTRVTSLTNETMGTYGMATAFDYELLKEPGPNADHSTWCPLNIDEAHPVPPAWIANRNERRNLPDPYMAEVFTTVSHNADEYRAKIIQLFVTTKR